MMTKLMSDDLTIVYLVWRKRRRNYRILFGNPERFVRLDWQRSLAAFKPGQIFGYERWQANKFGTQHWSIHVLEAGQPGDHISTTAGVKPGAIMLAKREGKSACKGLLNGIDQLRAENVLNDLTATKWRLVNSDIYNHELIDPTLKNMSKV